MPKRSLTLAAVAAVAFVAPAAARAQTPALPAAQTAPARAPDYSGTWELDLAASNFGPLPKPTRITMVIAQTATGITIAQTNVTEQLGEQKVSSAYVFGGPEVAGPGPNATTKVAFEGGLLTFNTMLQQQQGMDIPVNSRWTLAPDGKRLTIDRVITTPGGEILMQMVLARK